jgi:hypothetical protein
MPASAAFRKIASQATERSNDVVFLAASLQGEPSTGRGSDNRLSRLRDPPEACCAVLICVHRRHPWINTSLFEADAEPIAHLSDFDHTRGRKTSGLVGRFAAACPAESSLHP